MFGAEVGPTMVCDSWEAIVSDHTARIKKLNRILASATKRVDELEPVLAGVVQPILEQAGEVAAAAFVARVSAPLVASSRRRDLDALAGLDRDTARRVVVGLALTASGADINSRSAMVALYPRPAEAAAVADAMGEAPELMHVTLAYLGEPTDDTLDTVKAALGIVAGTHGPIEGTVGGVGVFADGGSGHPAILLPDVPGLVELRQAVCAAITGAEVEYATNHGYTAHLTVGYRGQPNPPDHQALGAPLHFDELAIVQGDKVLLSIPLTGIPSLTAAVTAGRFDTSDLPASVQVAVADAEDAIRSAGVPIPETVKFVELPDSDSATARLLPNGDIGLHVDTSAETITSSVVHEYGHWYDSRVLGTPDDWGTSQTKLDPLYQELKSSPTMQAVRNDEVKILQGDTSTRNYMLQGREMFARAFEQYVTVKSGNPILTTHLEKVAADPLLGFQYWQPDEFGPIAEAIDRTFMEAGVKIEAAADAGVKATWTMPAADEILRVNCEGPLTAAGFDAAFCLAHNLRTKTDPVRQELIRTVMGPAMPLTDLAASRFKVTTYDPHQVEGIELRLDDQIMYWEDEHAYGVATDAITEAKSGDAGRLWVLEERESGKLTAIANVEKVKELGIYAVHNVAAEGGQGAGTTLLKLVASDAHTDGLGVGVVSTPEAEGYYEKLPGWQRVESGDLTEGVNFELPPDKTSAFSKGVGKQASTHGDIFDVTNPLTAKVFAQTGSQIVGIAQTTQADVMAIIRMAYEQGLSIPDTAKAIRTGMAEASIARATLIARTEMVGAVNGGSLAATQLVESATGGSYEKTWLTAPGAHFPRHEDYEGLDEQTVALDAVFDVGGSMLQFPGDPDGPAEEVCNCRCTLVYVDAAGVQTEADLDMG